MNLCSATTYLATKTHASGGRTPWAFCGVIGSESRSDRGVGLLLEMLGSTTWWLGRTDRDFSACKLSSVLKTLSSVLGFRSTSRSLALSSLTAETDKKESDDEFSTGGVAIEI